LDLRTITENPSAIDFLRIKINSSAAWDIAMKYASDKGRNLASVSYVLQQKGFRLRRFGRCGATILLEDTWGW